MASLKSIKKLKISQTTVVIGPNPADPTGNWIVDTIKAKKSDTVTWRCTDKSALIFVMFPSVRTPLPNNQTECNGKGFVKAHFSKDAGGYYPYCILVQDANGSFHTVDGNSPPTMIID